jgi:hypothetical protein
MILPSIPGWSGAEQHYGKNNQPKQIRRNRIIRSMTGVIVAADTSHVSPSWLLF